MGRIENGIMGPFTGKVGTVVGSSWKGVHYMKSRPIRTKAAGPEEKANRNKFAMAQNWLQPVLRFVREGFKNYTPTVEGFLAAKSWLLRHSFEGTSPDISINPALVKLSHGTLVLPDNIRMEKKNGNELHFSWDRNQKEDGYAKDQVMIVAYDIEHQNATMISTGQFRETGNEMMLLQALPGKTFHVYLAFIAAQRTRQSESVYLGAVTI